MDYKLKTVSTTLETPNNTEADSTCSSPHKTVVTIAQIQKQVLPDATKTRNRGEAATTLENYGRAAVAIPTAASRASVAKNKMINYNSYLHQRT